MLLVNNSIAVTSPTLDPSTKGLRTGQPSQPNMEYYLMSVEARPEYGFAFRVSLPISRLLSNWSLDNIQHQNLISKCNLKISEYQNH